MNAHFGRRFSDVRIHADASADAATRARRSLAFSDGEHLYFRAGYYQPFTRSGQALIAHELTHTLQRRQTERPGDSSGVDVEHEARRTADAFTAGRPAGPIRGALTGVGLQNDLDVFAPSSTELRDADVPIAGVADNAPQTPGLSEPTPVQANQPAGGCGTVTCPPPADFGLLPVDPHITSGSLCRGACGPDCPSTCVAAPVATFTVPDSTGRCHATCTYTGLRCGSHQGCREHDTCYDAADGWWAHRGCDLAAVDKWGIKNTKSWVVGGGPYDSFLNFYNLGTAGTPSPN